MKILHTSDWHLGKSLENINRIKEQEEFIDHLCNMVIEQDIDLVLIAGDIYDTYNPSAAAEELFYSAINRLNDNGKRGVVIIAGNHDNPERLCAANPLATQNGIILLGYPWSVAQRIKSKEDKIKILDSGPGWMEIYISRCKTSAVIITLPYPSESRLEELLSRETDESRLQRAYSDRIGEVFEQLEKKYREDTVNLAIAHIFLQGGKESESERTLQVGGALTVDPVRLPSKAHYVALGHLHRPQRVKGANCPAYYSGSPLAYSFSESNYTKAVYMIEAIPGREAKVEELILNCGRPLRKWEARGGIEEAISWCEEGKDKGAWIDLEIHTDRVLTPDEQRCLRELNPGIINIRPVIKADDEDFSSFEDREKKRIDELFREYYRFRSGVEITEELMAEFLDVINETEDDIEKGVGEDETRIS